MAKTEDRSASDSVETWRETLYAAVPERDELLSTISGLETEPLYTPENVELDYQRDLGYPGEPPFTRGV
ncbi:MAG: methylmalonyl-CoA mutase, partial [Actinobacteria bacterium]